MDTTYMIVTIAAVLAILIVGVILAPAFIRSKHSKQIQEDFGTEYDHTLDALGDKKKTITELEERQKHVQSLNIHPLSDIERERYTADWGAVQSKFVDEPGQAVEAADRLIMEVMQMRAYPVSDFEQRAADISVSYPSLVSNYRAARKIALKNKQGQANTEELRQAMMYYRSLFDELLESESVMA